MECPAYCYHIKDSRPFQIFVILQHSADNYKQDGKEKAVSEKAVNIYGSSGKQTKHPAQWNI